MKGFQQLPYVGLALLFGCVSSLASVEVAETWCECRQSGLMEIPVKMSISSEGRVVALVERRTKERAAYRYETRLSPEERSYLSTLLAASDFMNRPHGDPMLKDGGNLELRVCQNGRTNVVHFNWLGENSEWGALGEFFGKLATQAAGMRLLESGLLDCMAQDWLQREKVIEPLKRYLHAPKHWGGASAALSILAKNMRAEEWVGFVALTLQDADVRSRDIILYALCAYQIPLQSNLPGMHREKLQQLLKVMGELGSEGNSKQLQRERRLFPPDGGPAR